MIGEPVSMPLRLDRLWEKTCFECFIGTYQSNPYWEFNLSPAGHWNVYRFDSYRSGMEEESLFPSLPFHVEKQADLLNLSISFGLNKILSSDQPLKMGVSAVVQSKEGETTYWALAHPGPAPDFHHRNGFLLEL